MTHYDRLTHPQTPTDAGIRPNILILMVDQLAGTFFPDGPAPFLHAPNLRALAARSARFANAYTASPLCAPARASFMSGLLPSRTRVYDNAAEFASDIPTFAHHLRRAGYQTCLSGKMHFVGPDQLHGFEERLTTDIYPADFGWTPDYTRPDERIDWWYHNLGSVTGAGTAEITNQLEYDDEVAFHATAKLYDLARGHDPRPWCLTVSFTHPHDPYVARPRFWDLYADCPALDPETGRRSPSRTRTRTPAPDARRDHAAFEITPEDVRRARRAYFANISYVDEKIGELLAVLDARRHGRRHRHRLPLRPRRHARRARPLVQDELLRGLRPRAADARRPRPRARPRRHAGLDSSTSCPTLAELAGVDTAVALPTARASSPSPAAPPAARCRWNTPPKARVAPMVALRDGRWKLTVCDADPPQLFDLEADPHEATEPRRRPRPRRHPRPPHRRRPRPLGPRRFDRECAKARRAAASSTRRCATAPTPPGTTSRCSRRPSATCATTWT